MPAAVYNQARYYNAAFGAVKRFDAIGIAYHGDERLLRMPGVKHLLIKSTRRCREQLASASMIMLISAPTRYARPADFGTSETTCMRWEAITAAIIACRHGSSVKSGREYL